MTMRCVGGQIEDLSPEELAARAILAVNDVEAEVAAGDNIPGDEAEEVEEEMQQEENVRKRMAVVRNENAHQYF